MYIYRRKKKEKKRKKKKAEHTVPSQCGTSFFVFLFLFTRYIRYIHTVLKLKATTGLMYTVCFHSSFFVGLAVFFHCRLVSFLQWCLPHACSRPPLRVAALFCGFFFLHSLLFRPHFCFPFFLSLSLFFFFFFFLVCRRVLLLIGVTFVLILL